MPVPSILHPATKTLRWDVTMEAKSDSAKVAVVQASPLYFDREGSVEKVARMTQEAGKEGAGLVVFPEAYVGGYPWGLAFGTAVGGGARRAGAPGNGTGPRPWRCLGPRRGG
jgi:hypothetical protein